MPTHSTGPEMMVRKALHKKGMRYRVQYPVPGHPRRSIDIAFPRSKVAVFVDGCFWHGCASHRTIPVNNRAWWKEKIEGNQKRDRETDEHLHAIGWTVLRYWEHDSPEDITVEVVDVVSSRKSIRT